MKKIAIITWCYDNGTINFGQVLQCYALQEFCRSLYCEVKIIKYRALWDNEELSLIPKGIEREKYEYGHRDQYVESQSREDVQKVLKFIKRFIHLSQQCYTAEELINVTKDCNYLIAGSDQIWNPLWFDKNALLIFASAHQHKISYATAGISNDIGKNKKIIQLIAKEIDSFKSVSVREPISKEILNRYTTKEISDVLDPTLILSEERWNRICSERQVKEEYILCYCIGEIRPHKHVLKYAMSKYKVQNIVYIDMSKRKLDFCNGRFMIGRSDIGPMEFLALIRYAKAIFTDSFHGFAFSVIYKKEYYIMGRAYDTKEIFNYSRIKNIMIKFDIPERWANTKQDVDKAPPINYKSSEKKYRVWVEKSQNYIKAALDIEWKNK